MVQVLTAATEILTCLEIPDYDHSPTFCSAPPVLATCILERLQKAVCGLADGSLTVTLTRQTETDIRALVKNGEGSAYGVTLTDTLTTCSCKDALYRGVVCKHACAVSLFVLRTPTPQPEVEAPALPVPVDVPEIPMTIAPTVVSPVTHLSWRDSLVCCGLVSPPKSFMYPWPSSVLNAPDTCKNCVAIHVAGYNAHMLHLTKTKAA